MSKIPRIFEELTHIASIIPTPVYWLDTNYIIVGGNDLCLSAIGSNAKTMKEGLIGKTYYDYYPKDIACEKTRMITIVLETNKATKTEEKIVDVTTGKFRYYETARAPLYDKGKIVGTICTAIEITDKKEAERLTLENHQIEKEQQEEFREIVEHVVHDIRSPLMVMDGLVNDISTKIPEEDAKKLKSQVQNIRYIANNMLDQRRNKIINLNTTQEKSFHLLNKLVNLVKDQKDIEWQDDMCTIKIKSVISDIIWVNVIETEFIRMLSNLLNNSYEAYEAYESYKQESTKNKEIQITIELLGNDETRLTIQDYGCGIPEAEIKNILIGKSLKDNGNGLGLSGAIAYINSIGGKLELKSKEHFGTTIEIILPKLAYPKWWNKHIIIPDNYQIVIVDDNPNIHLRWQKRFISNPKKPIHFLNGDEFTNWYTNQANHNDYIIFMDYELGGNSSGLDILKNLKVLAAYLVTDHTEQSWLQSMIMNTNYYLLPKSILEIIPIDNKISLKKLKNSE